MGRIKRLSRTELSVRQKKLSRSLSRIPGTAVAARMCRITLPNCRRELREKGLQRGQSRIVRDWMLKHHGTRKDPETKEGYTRLFRLLHGYRRGKRRRHVPAEGIRTKLCLTTTSYSDARPRSPPLHRWPVRSSTRMVSQARSRRVGTMAPIVAHRRSPLISFAETSQPRRRRRKSRPSRAHGYAGAMVRLRGTARTSVSS